LGSKAYAGYALVKYIFRLEMPCEKAIDVTLINITHMIALLSDLDFAKDWYSLCKIFLILHFTNFESV
jgi:hypothetical protein